MQRDPLPAPAAAPLDPASRPRRPADVPSDQLWLEAIAAARQAATAAAELRVALQASRSERGSATGA